MRDAPPDLHMINVVVRDMAATVEFYRRLGVVPGDDEEMSGPHVRATRSWPIPTGTMWA